MLKEVYYVISYNFEGKEVGVTRVFDEFPTHETLETIGKMTGAYEVKIDKRYRIET